MYIGTVLYGYCDGYFGRDDSGDKRIEAIGADWIVVRYINDLNEGCTGFCSFKDTAEMEENVKRWGRPERE